MTQRDNRFSLGWMLLMTALAAIMFGILSALGLSPGETVTGIAVIVSTVGLIVLMIELISRLGER